MISGPQGFGPLRLRRSGTEHQRHSQSQHLLPIMSGGQRPPSDPECVIERTLRGGGRPGFFSRSVTRGVGWSGRPSPRIIKRSLGPKSRLFPPSGPDSRGRGGPFCGIHTYVFPGAQPSPVSTPPPPATCHPGHPGAGQAHHPTAGR